MLDNQQAAKGYGVTAVLGPTNTGKTHLAIERMAAYGTGLIGLPLRLLAREVYERLVAKVGEPSVSLVTGEERIAPANARFQVCTVEAMPEKTDAEFVAIDEIQLATDLERGHYFTDRLLHLRGTHETMLLGAETVSDALRELLPGISVVSRPRMSLLTYDGSRKITRIPPRSAIVAFSVDQVYAIAELVRREKGGTAVVTGALSPRTRNAQVALYQSGDVDTLVATDAIGMGLNLDVKHVAFAQDRKFDGFQHRKLTAAEIAQIAGRAGRHTVDGTFGVTSRVPAFEPELVEALETHTFQPLKTLTWRNRNLDYSSVEALKSSLEAPATHSRLVKSPPATDLLALDYLANIPEIAARTRSEQDVHLLWDVARIPDYRKISPADHGETLSNIFLQLSADGRIDPKWLEEQLRRTDNTKGEIDALSARIASVRTWTYLSNRENWLENASNWREKTRDVEDRLSDALHESLTKRFVDRRTSFLMKRLKENRMPEAEIDKDGIVSVEGHRVGRIQGFKLIPESMPSGKDAKAVSSAAAKVLSSEIEKIAERFCAAPNSDFTLGNDGLVRWIGQPVGKLAKDTTPLRPKIIPLCDESLTGPALEKVKARLDRWLANHINTELKPLADLSTTESLEGIAKGVAFRIVENLGVLPRQHAAEDLKNLDQEVRGVMRRIGVRFGAYNVFIPILLKPAPTQLICILWAVFNDKLDAPGLTEIPELSAAGRTSIAVDKELERGFYRLSGFRILGERAVRIDILERLADLIRPAMSWKADSSGDKPEGAVDGQNFVVTPAMMSILGATHEDMEKILRGLGYKGEARPAIAIKGSPADEQPPASEQSGAQSEPISSSDVPVKSEQPEGATETASTDTVAEEEQTVLVWRYSGPNRASNTARHSKGQRNKGRKGKQPKRTNSTQPDKKSKQGFDPDSPFASLAKLKADLQTGND